MGLHLISDITYMGSPCTTDLAAPHILSFSACASYPWVRSVDCLQEASDELSGCSGATEPPHVIYMTEEVWEGLRVCEQCADGLGSPPQVSFHVPSLNCKHRTFGEIMTNHLIRLVAHRAQWGLRLANSAEVCLQRNMPSPKLNQ